MNDGFNFMNRIIPEIEQGGGDLVMSSGPAAGPYSRPGRTSGPDAPPARDPQGPSLGILLLVIAIVYLSTK